MHEEQHYEKVTRKGKDKKLKVSGRGTCEMHAALQNGHSLAELLLGELNKCSTIVTRGLVQWKTLDCHILHVAKNTKVATLSHPGEIALFPAWDDGTIPWNMHCSKSACYPLGVCDRRGSPGSGSPLFNINS